MQTIGTPRIDLKDPCLIKNTHKKQNFPSIDKIYMYVNV